MNLGEIYELFYREGMCADPRRPREVQAKLRRSREEYRKLFVPLRKFFDTERLRNPYADSRILFGDRRTPVRRMIVGIDIEVGELLLAAHLSREGSPIDAVLAHHPEGVALAGLDDVMDLQTDLLIQQGISTEVAKDLMSARTKEVCRRLHSANHTRAVDAAKLLNLPFLCCHTPADNHVVQYLERLIRKNVPKNLGNLIDLLLREPEYQDAARNNAGPRILIGKPKDQLGKTIVDMTGGTEGSKDIFARLSQLGVNTLLGMHLSEDHFLKIKSEHLKVVIAGHMASDNLGMNLLLDKLEKKSRIEIIECSGFRRYKRG